MPRLWAMTTTFESVSVGDQLPILLKWETAESIRRFHAPLKPDEVLPVSICKSGDIEAGADHAVFNRALNAYVSELLEKGFPIPSDQAADSILDIQTLRPFKPGDIISLTGRVVDKRMEGDRRLVKCEIVVENQGAETVATATAIVGL